MDMTILYIVVGICVPVALLLCVILLVELRRMMAVTKLYAGEGRDLRFVCALLRHYLPGGKWRILRHPCILADDRNCPPRADLLIIGGGGLLVLTVDDRQGHFVTPPTGDWTLWQGKGYKKVPNRFNEGRKYTSVLNNLLVRAGLSCPVVNLIILSDDDATVDDLYAENVLTCDQLIPYLKRFCKGRMLSTARQKKLREVLAAHHVRCRKALEQVVRAARQQRMEEEADNASADADDLFGRREDAPAQVDNEGTVLEAAVDPTVQAEEQNSAPETDGDLQ